jgi:hypothetical protein
MVLGVRFEMHRQLIDALAQDCDLNLWRAGVRFVDPELGYRFALCFARQCHLGIDTPRLFLTVYFSSKNTTAGRGDVYGLRGGGGGWGVVGFGSGGQLSLKRSLLAMLFG